MTKEFKNEAQPIKSDDKRSNPNLGYYGYNRPSKYLFQWSRLLQATVSQAGTWIFQKKFHTHNCAIFKVEGGCYIDGKGELVLREAYCVFDYRNYDKGENQKMADLITNIVLKFDPMNPIDTIVGAASEITGCNKELLMKTVLDCHVGGTFGGDALADFFSWNPFSEPPVDRGYKRWCMVDFLKNKTHEEVDQIYADQDLGKELLGKLRDLYREKKSSSIPLCCSPNRSKNGLTFWINTGRNTQMDGWKTEKEIRDFIKTAPNIIDKAKY